MRLGKFNGAFPLVGRSKASSTTNNSGDGSASDNAYGWSGDSQPNSGVSASAIITGTDGDDFLYGIDSDQIYGMDGNDVISGRAGDDYLDGGAGDDLLMGDWEEDTLVGGDGRDILHGSEGSDALFGGAGNDSLDGGLGSDWLTGGAGSDMFYIRGPVGFKESIGVDVITDFNLMQVDLIYFAPYPNLDLPLSSPLAKGALSADNFGLGTVATGAQHILYDPETGDLRFDADGAGAIEAILFAKLTPGLELTADSFVIG